MKHLFFTLLVASLVVIFATMGYSAKLEGLLLLLLFEEGQGGVTEDISGNGYQGDIVGAKWTKGKFGKALEFNGKSDNVQVPGGGNHSRKGDAGGQNRCWKRTSRWCWYQSTR